MSADAPAGTHTAETGPGTLHGRMLHVSRLATIGEMAAGVAHELNQPLTAIANYAQACVRLLAKPGADTAELSQALQEIAAQAVRAGDIIRRLRTLARNDAIQSVSTDLNSVVSEIETLLQTDARVHGVRLSLHLAPGLPRVTLDRVQIQHVLLNLMRNGLEALQSWSGAREIEIRTSLLPTGEVEIAVTDSGPGLAPGEAERVFDPFFSTKENGTGLGLPISSTIARAHGGELGYRPHEPTGACFYIHLPCEADA